MISKRSWLEERNGRKSPHRKRTRCKPRISFVTRQRRKAFVLPSRESTDLAPAFSSIYECPPSRGPSSKIDFSCTPPSLSHAQVTLGSSNRAVSPAIRLSYGGGSREDHWPRKMS